MSHINILKEIFELSEKMLIAAKSYHWEKLQQLELEERALVTQIRTTPHPNQQLDTNQSRNLIQAILNNHDAIYSIAQPLLKDVKILLDAFDAPTEK